MGEAPCRELPQLPDWAWEQFVLAMLRVVGRNRLERAAAEEDSLTVRAKRDRKHILVACEHFCFDFLTSHKSFGLALLTPTRMDAILPTRLPDLRRDKCVPSRLRMRFEYQKALARARAVYKKLPRPVSSPKFQTALRAAFPTEARWLGTCATPRDAALEVLVAHYKTLGRETVQRMVYHFLKDRDFLGWERRAETDLAVLAAIRCALRKRAAGQPGVFD